MRPPVAPFSFLSVDPGRATGLVRVHVPAAAPAVLTHRATVAEPDLVAALNILGHPPEPPLLICERFVAREGLRGVDHSARTASALVNQWCRDHGVHLIKPLPPEKDSYPTAAVLRQLEWWTPGHGHRHEMDAARHGLVYLKRLPHLPTLRQGWPDE